MSLVHFFLVFLVVSIWGFNNIVIKWGLHDLPPLFMTCMRFIVVSIFLIPFKKIKMEQLKCLLPLSFTFGFLHFSLLFVGINYTDSGTGSILVQLGTPFSIFLAMIFLNERLTWIQITGILISLIGVIVLIGSPTITNWKALLLLLGSAIGWAISNMIIKKSPKIPSLTMTAWISFLAIPIVGLASILFETQQFNSLINATWRGWFAIFYSAIGSSIIAYSLWYVLLTKYQINFLMPYSLLTPVLAVIMGVFILNDSLNYFKVIGSVLVLLGTFISVIKFDIKSFLCSKKQIKN